MCNGILLSCDVIDFAMQGPKLTFLDRRQLATEIFFQSPDGKMLSPKSVNKIFSFAAKLKYTENYGRQFFV